VATRTELLRAELEAAELEEQLAAAKKDGPASHALKLQVREARKRFRELRGPTEVGPGDAVATPEPVKATGKANR
jgi:hypothetical protein